jgi:hypothetical protein
MTGTKPTRSISGWVITATLVIGIAYGTIRCVQAIRNSSTVFSHFTRIEVCSLCGVQQQYEEIGLLDHYPRQVSARTETAITHILQRSKPRRCEHCFYSLQERMVHISMKPPKWFCYRESGVNCGFDIFTNDKYVRSLQCIAQENRTAAQLIWSRTVRHAFNSNAIPLQEIRAVLFANSESQTTQFLRTNRFFRPARPNPERMFNRLN